MMNLTKDQKDLLREIEKQSNKACAESTLQALTEEVENLKPASYENGIKLLNEADVLNLITNLDQ